jgi:hypothetical protein
LSLALRGVRCGGCAGARRRWYSSSSSAGGEDEAKAGASNEEEEERPYFEEIANKATILNEIDHALGA